MATVAVLGGGISGLSCAYYLKNLARSRLNYIFLLEKNPKFGGWIQTTRFPDGAVFEHGPRTLRFGTISGYNALELADRLDLESRILPITKVQKTTNVNYILADKKLHAMPQNVSNLLKKRPPFSKALIWYIFKELRTKSIIIEDESVHSFIERRIGKEIADFVFDPLCRGITAGDSKELSIRSMFPSIFEAEQQHGSIIKGILKNQKESERLKFMQNNLVKKAVSERWRMWTLQSGLTELIDALACSIEEKDFCDLAFNAPCSEIVFKNGKAELTVDNEKIVVDHVFSCIPSFSLAKIIPSQPKLCSVLNSIPFIDMAVVYLEYKDNVLSYPGFGFLVPSFEDSKILGVVFDSNCFPSLNGDNRTRLTCMIGGRWFKEVLGDINSVSKDFILKTAIEEVGRHLGIQASPSRSLVSVEKQCIPQYVVGHHKKLQNAEYEIKSNNLCLSLLGNSYKAAGVPDCIYNSKLVVEEYLQSK